jgi:hypothetical protein
MLLLGLAGLGGCEAASTEACRSNADCVEPGEECIDRDAPNVCGVPPRENCSGQADCMAELRCHAIADSCSHDGVGSECAPPCTSDGACGQGFRCGDDGACVAVTCTEGFSCEPWQACDVGAIDTPVVHERHHGCVATTCARDADCPDALVCVNAYCQTGPGACGEPLLVP